MTDYERLRALLRGKPYVIVDAATGRVRLGAEASTLRAMNDGGEFPASFFLNAGEALERFARLWGVGEDDRTFTLKNIGAIIGDITNVGAWKYGNQGIITPTIRGFGGSGRGDVEAQFSFADAFSAGIIGTMRRYGLRRPDVLKKVQPLFTGKPKKRTARKTTTS